MIWYKIARKRVLVEYRQDGNEGPLHEVRFTHRKQIRPDAWRDVVGIGGRRNAGEGKDCCMHCAMARISFCCVRGGRWGFCTPGPPQNT